MKRFALVMVFLVTALPALAHEEQERRVYLLERKIERLEQRVDRLELMSRVTAPPPTDEQKKLTAEQQEMFDCQANAINSTEMKACAKYIPD